MTVDASRMVEGEGLVRLVAARHVMAAEVPYVGKPWDFGTEADMRIAFASAPTVVHCSTLSREACNVHVAQGAVAVSR